MLQLKVLVLEDDELLLKNMSSILSREVAELYTFSDSKSALEEVDTLNPDVIISDIHMAGMSGLEFISEVRKKHPHISIVIASAFSNSEYFQEAIRLKVDRFLIKPIIFDELLSFLEKLESTISLQRDLAAQSKILEAYKSAVYASSYITLTDRDGKITYVNDSFVQLSGYSREELIGNTHKIIASEEDNREKYTQIWQTLLNKEIWKGTLINKKKSGELFYVKTTIVPILDLEENISEFISINQDITQLMRAYREEQKMNTLKDDFLRNISHEMKTPLNAIHASAKLLARKFKDEKYIKLLDIITSSSDEFLLMVDSLIDLSKLVDGNYTLHKEAINLYDALLDLMERYKPKIDQKNLTFRYQFSESLKESCSCDFKLIHYVINALITNAIKFSYEKGTIALKIDKRDEELYILIKDRGVGIDPNQLNTMTQLFTQKDSSMTREFEGLGIGLTLTQAIIELLEGNLDVKSDDENGTLFSVTLKLR